MKKVYIQLFSPHGLIRFNSPEIGRDKDTGGQVKYVLELIKALSESEMVRKVDLFTRRISDKRVSQTYAEEIEQINDKARIVRISCGGLTYRRKESLWKYLDEYIDKTIRFIKGQQEVPDVVHGHYADGNYIAYRLSRVFGIPLVATSHSLGRNKKRILQEQGLSEDKMNSQFAMDQRIAVEEMVLRSADLVIASTQHEIETQYKLYDAYESVRFKVVPPGLDTQVFYPFYRPEMPSFAMTIEQEQAIYRINSEIDRFLYEPAKPLILSIGRPDKRKNFETLIKAFGTDEELKSIANLAIFAGIRKDISKMVDDEKEILTNLLLLLDKYDLYGKLAIPKKNDPKREIPEIYRLAARKKGVFVNATPGENFGLTVVESAASGLPVIASPDGGPKEIIGKCENGLLIDVEDYRAIAEAAKKIITNAVQWEKYSANGIKGVDQHFSWKAHVESYLGAIKEVLEASNAVSTGDDDEIESYGLRFSRAKHFLISDIDGTLIDEEQNQGLEMLGEFIESRKKEMVFGIATGRNQQLTREVFQKYQLPEPDILICSAGSEIYYTKKFIPDKGWESYISYQWKRNKLMEVLRDNPKLELQGEDAQWKFKLSYFVDPGFSDDDLANIYAVLDRENLKATVLLTEGSFLDFLPVRASKGKAIKYLSFKWNLPLNKFITAGNSGNDIDMLRGDTKGIVVANFSPEMEILKKRRNVYFSNKAVARGVMEGIKHYLSES